MACFLRPLNIYGVLDVSNGGKMKAFNILVVLFLSIFLFLSCSTSSRNSLTLPITSQDTTLSFLTLNMDVGFEAGNLLTVNLLDSQTVFTQGKLLYQQFLASHALERLQVLADSIVRTAPDVVCLQEVLFFRNLDNAEIVDFVSVLLHDIDSLGGPAYSNLRQHHNAISLRVKNSVHTDSLNILASEGNAILFKNAALTLLSADSLNYIAEIPPLPLLGALITPQRGVIFARFKTDKQTIINLFTTHLEDGSSALDVIGDAQAVELASFINSKGGSSETQFLAGDFNQTPGGARVTVIKTLGFLDLYDAVNHSDAETCCYNVADTTVPLTEKIDYIFGKNFVSVQSAKVRLNGSFTIPGVGGFRVSDHAGVGASVTFH